jgi:TRAP-type C4-dicarboxylate transport system permease small subunit
MQSPSPPLKAVDRQIVSKRTIIALAGKVLRLTSLSILFAGSAGIVFAAVTLIQIGQSNGLPVSTSALANAPIFLYFSKIAAGAAVALLLAEAIDSFVTSKFTQPKIFQYISTAACCLCAFNFAFVVAPEMEYLLPFVKNNVSIGHSFHGLHETSRLLFMGMILFSWVSLILPVFFEKKD